MQRNFFLGFYILGLLAATFIRARFGRREGDGSRGPRKSALDLLLLGFTAVGMLLPLVGSFTPIFSFSDYTSWVWLRGVGGAMFLCAVLLLGKSHADLGRNWALVPEIRDGHALVETGVFAHVRHPIYLAYLLWGLGQIALFSNWVTGPATLLGFVPLYYSRVGREEKMLLKHFGEDYARYMRRTGRLIPRLTRLLPWGTQAD